METRILESVLYTGSFYFLRHSVIGRLRTMRKLILKNVFEISGNGWEWFGKKIFAFLGKMGVYDNIKFDTEYFIWQVIARIACHFYIIF